VFEVLLSKYFFVFCAISQQEERPDDQDILPRKRSISQLSGLYASERRLEETLEMVQSYIRNNKLEPALEVRVINGNYFVCVKEQDKTKKYSPECNKILRLVGNKNIPLNHFEKMIELKQSLEGF
jgi:hypothetical protein